jgi:hypothetical protein
MNNFWKSADFSPKYQVYEDAYGNREVVSTGPDIMGGLFSGFLGSYAKSRQVSQETINDAELILEKNNRQVYGGTITNMFTSKIKVNKGQLVRITSTGSMKLGYMLSGVSPYGVDGYDNYSITNRIRHGALMVKVGKGGWMPAGMDQVLSMPDDGFLIFAVNDQDSGNNTGYYDFSVEMMDGMATDESNPKVTANATEAIPLSDPSFLKGSWKNIEGITAVTIPQLVIYKNGWGKCSPTFCDWGPVKATLADGVIKVTWQHWQTGKWTTGILSPMKDGTIKMVYTSGNKGSTVATGKEWILYFDRM